MERTSRRRVIINTDAKNEADDQFAIVHALLSPTLDIRGLIAAHFGRSRSERSMEESREEIDLLLELTGLEQQVTVANGAPTGIADEQTPRDSDGAQLIIAESKLASAKEPLFVAFLGPLTDMASAILLDPAILDREVVVIWIGGVGLRGRREPSRRRVQPAQRHRRGQRGLRLRHHRMAGAQQCLLAGVGRLHRAGGEDRWHQQAR